ncbi:MAG: DinB family protein [Aliishimia sp.]
MISVEYCATMARYNTWQNNSLVTASDGLSDADRWRDRGAFFQSIAATLNHIYWADALILQRLRGNQRPDLTIKHSLSDPSDWSDFKRVRSQRNDEIEQWANQLRDVDLIGTVIWYSADGSTRVEKPTALCAVELFHHQTHHRGQVHAMLTAAGAKPEPTNLSMMV